jgi:hypothetical protein
MSVSSRLKSTELSRCPRQPEKRGGRLSQQNPLEAATIFRKLRRDGISAEFTNVSGASQIRYRVETKAFYCPSRYNQVRRTFTFDPSDLAHHSVIVGPAPLPIFSFRKDSHVTSVRVDSQLAITVNEGATASAVAGLGSPRRAKTARGQSLRPGSSCGCSRAGMEVNGLFVSGKTIKRAARAFTKSFLRELLAA